MTPVGKLAGASLEGSDVEVWSNQNHVISESDQELPFEVSKQSY